MLSRRTYQHFRPLLTIVGPNGETTVMVVGDLLGKLEEAGYPYTITETEAVIFFPNGSIELEIIGFI